MHVKLFKQVLMLFMLLFVLTCNTGCEKEIPPPPPAGPGPSPGPGPGPTPTNTGRVTFWNDQTWVGVITVYIGSTSGAITSSFQPSGCGESGCANFTLNPGSYSFSASATTGETWSGSATITAGGCLRYNLY